MRMLLLSILLFLSGCGFFSPEGWGAAPRPVWMSLPQDDSPFGQGWTDGCKTAVGIIGEGMLRTHGFSYDALRALEDKDYSDGYNTGYNTCSYALSPGVN